MNTNQIIDSVENFWDVRIVSVRGDVLEVQRRLCDYFIIDRQSAKKLLKQPSVIFRAGKHTAQKQFIELEALGLKCELVHAGPAWLDRYDDAEIRETLRFFNGGTLDGIFLEEVTSGRVEIRNALGEPMPITSQDETGEQSHEELDEALGFYLACIRYLAKKNAVA